MHKLSIQNIFFFVLFVVFFLLVGRIFLPFTTIILWSTLLYILFNPLYSRLETRLNPKKPLYEVRKSLLAAFFSIATMILIILPLLWILFQLYHQLVSLSRLLIHFFTQNPNFLDAQLEQLKKIVFDLSGGQISFDESAIKGEFFRILQESSQRLFSIGTGVIKNIGSFVVGLFFMLFTLFFLYLDGTYLYNLIVRAIPIKREYIGEYIGELATKFREIVRNLFLGYILVAFIQALIAFVLFSLFQLKGSLVFSILLFFCTFIPIMGAGLVWGPLGLYIIFSGQILRGVLFLILSAFFISTLDNFIRPLFLKDRINLHPLIIFFSILGGVSAFKFNGLILGPVIVILFLTVLDLFLNEQEIDNGEEKNIESNTMVHPDSEVKKGP
ncbi:MAG TPA: AI-2E family transporter [Termitinemataceae bacterium]|nr:AI-2E family transporter [Termitinemataceae bacterium]HOM22556.1 AI-2E family transporter [Termitinemataceae bacterium]HPQ00088.1 AI-2E family transporter [Termitinemataceae bacterium]